MVQIETEQIMQHGCLMSDASHIIVSAGAMHYCPE